MGLLNKGVVVVPVNECKSSSHHNLQAAAVAAAVADAVVAAHVEAVRGQAVACLLFLSNNVVAALTTPFVYLLSPEIHLFGQCRRGGDQALTGRGPLLCLA